MFDSSIQKFDDVQNMRQPQRFEYIDVKQYPHFELLIQGTETWNSWREQNPIKIPNFRKVNLKGVNLQSANLRNIDFAGATFESANLAQADFSNAILTSVNFADSNLQEADLKNSDLSKSDLSRTSLKRANLTNVNLSKSILIDTDFENSNLSGCRIFGISAWKVNLKNAVQENLIITDIDEPTIAVDNLEVAQFVYLLVNNEKIRDVVMTVGKKAVLLLGRFTPKTKTILDSIKSTLRKNGYLPILFDFDKPSNRDFTETISILAHLSKFIIADLSDARSIPHELQALIPNLPSVLFQPILSDSETEYFMFQHFERYPWVLPLYRYSNENQLLQTIENEILPKINTRLEQLRKDRTDISNFSEGKP